MPRNREDFWVRCRSCRDRHKWSDREQNENGVFACPQCGDTIYDRGSPS